jgi:hypothetical protein
MDIKCFFAWHCDLQHLRHVHATCCEWFLTQTCVRFFLTVCKMSTSQIWTSVEQSNKQITSICTAQKRMLAGMLTYTLTWMSLSSNWHKFWLEEKEAWKVFLVWRKVQKGTFKHNTYVIKHHELSTQVLLMTRNWNQTKNNSNLRHIATGHLRTYKSRNLSEANATVRISRDKKHIYTYVYIWTSLKDCTRITKLKPFSAQSWDMGSSDHIKRNETNRTLLDVLRLLWIPSLKYRKLKFHSKRIKHFASQVFSVVPPIRDCARKGRKFWGTREGGYKILGKGILNPPHPPLELGKCPWT